MTGIYSSIKKIRIMRGFSQQNMAEELNMSQRHYGRIENGSVDITYSLLCKIGSILEIKLHHLISMDEAFPFDNANELPKNPISSFNTNEMQNIIKLYERLLKEKDAHIDSLKVLLESKK